MPTTSRMGWQYPTEDQKDWWDIWVSLMNQMDTDAWATFENGFLVLLGGGTLSLVGSTFTWTADLYVVSTLSGGKARIPAGSITIADGQIAYVDISRPLASNYDVTLLVTSSPLIGVNQRNSIFVALRNGSQLVMRPFATVV